MTPESVLIELSNRKWQWMSERNVTALGALFHEKSVFVHMGMNLYRDDEMEVIRSGTIHYRDIDIKNVSARLIGSTAIVLSDIRLVAVIGGNEIANPFMVTEVYVQESGDWKLASLSFTRLVLPEGTA